MMMPSVAQVTKSSTCWRVATTGGSATSRRASIQPSTMPVI